MGVILVGDVSGVCEGSVWVGLVGVCVCVWVSESYVWV